MDEKDQFWETLKEARKADFHLSHRVFGESDKLFGLIKLKKLDLKRFHYNRLGEFYNAELMAEIFTSKNATFKRFVSPAKTHLLNCFAKHY